MEIELPGSMEAFGQVAHGQLFMTFIDQAAMFGMRIKMDRSDAVLHLNGGTPKVVDEVHFVNRDVLALKEIVFKFPEMTKAKSGNPEPHNYGVAILSGEGTFIRSAHANGPFDVEIGKGIVKIARSHPGSFWFDAWEVALMRPGKPETLFSHGANKVTRKPLA